MDLKPALDFVAENSRGVVITIRPNGMPHASNIVYAVFDDAVHVSVTDGRVKTANARRDPRGVLHVTGPDFRSWVVLEGDIRLSAVTRRPEDQSAALLRRTYETVAGPHPDWDDFNRAMIEDRRLVMSLVPTRAYGQLP